MCLKPQGADNQQILRKTYVLQASRLRKPTSKGVPLHAALGEDPRKCCFCNVLAVFGVALCFQRSNILVVLTIFVFSELRGLNILVVLDMSCFPGTRNFKHIDVPLYLLVS